MDTLVDMSTCEVQQLAEGVQYRFACNSRDKLVKHMLHRRSEVIIVRLCAAVGAFVMMLLFLVVMRMVMMVVVAVHGGHSCIATPLCGHQSTARDTHTATTS